MYKNNFFHSFLISNKYFIGNNLLDELSFINYFHYNLRNIFLHIIGFHCLFYCLLSISKVIKKESDLFIIIGFVMILMLIDYKELEDGEEDELKQQQQDLQGQLNQEKQHHQDQQQQQQKQYKENQYKSIKTTKKEFSLVPFLALFILLLIDLFLRYNFIHFSIHFNIILSIFFGLFGGILQLIGHIIYDQSQPAFRLFEAFITTPYFLYLSILFYFNYNLKFKKLIFNNTKKWKGSERVIYGKRKFIE